MAKYIKEPGSYLVKVIAQPNGYLHLDDKGRIALKIPLENEAGEQITWSAYLNTEGGKARAAKGLVEGLGAPSDWAQRLMSRQDILRGKETIVVVEFDRDQSGAVKTGKNGQPFVNAKWLNSPNRRTIDGVAREIDLNEFAGIAAELESISRNLGAELEQEPIPRKAPVDVSDFDEVPF